MRLEDLDRPREVAGSAAGILRTLEAFGFEWDGEALSQNSRLEAYGAALRRLSDRGLLFACHCSRTQLADESRYPGTCREAGRPFEGAAVRLCTRPGHLWVNDRIQGIFRQDVAAATGDFVVRRRDGIYPYVLAVVVDDAAQGVTHVVRGADLLDNTPRQMYLQQVLGLPTPHYAHVPVLCEPGGAKLAKSRRSVRIAATGAAGVNPRIIEVLGLLGLDPPAELLAATRGELWEWATQAWRIEAVPARLALNLGR